MPLKYSYGIIYTIYPPEHNNFVMKKFSMGRRVSSINIYNDLNTSYIPYYIQETKKLLSGERKEELEIHISDQEEYQQYPDEYIYVNKEWAYLPKELKELYYKDELEENQRIETDQLLEFLIIMKKELEIGDEVVVDQRTTEERIRQNTIDLENYKKTNN